MKDIPVEVLSQILEALVPEYDSAWTEELQVEIIVAHTNTKDILAARLVCYGF